MKRVYLLHLAIAGLTTFSIYETIRSNKLGKELKETKQELAATEDKLQSVHNRLTDLQSRVSDLQGSISDLYYNRTSDDIEEAEGEADDLMNDINEAEEEANQ